MKSSMLILATVLVGTAVVHAQQPENTPRPPSVTANGEAVVTAEPDQAEIDIGVVTQAKNAPDAARENADKLTRVMAEVKKISRQGR